MKMKMRGVFLAHPPLSKHATPLLPLLLLEQRGCCCCCYCYCCCCCCCCLRLLLSRHLVFVFVVDVVLSVLLLLLLLPQRAPKMFYVALFFLLRPVRTFAKYDTLNYKTLKLGREKKEGETFSPPDIIYFSSLFSQKKDPERR